MKRAIAETSKAAAAGGVMLQTGHSWLFVLVAKKNIKKKKKII